MQLYDKDLLSVQEVRELVEKAKAAQEELAGKSQQDVDRIVKAIAQAGVRNARRLGKMAHEETGFGTEADKTIKNIFASDGVYQYIKDMKTIGELERDEKKKVRTLAVPVGVIAGLIPSTNPTSTVFYKAEISIKAGNAIVFSPHPNARNSILEAVKVIRQAIAEAGGNEDLVTCITIPTMQATDNLMKHPDVALILATGGSAMVRSAYSSGTPAIGVGPGNGPAYIEKTADVKLAVKRIMADQVQKEMESQGAYFLTDEQIQKLGNFILRANGTMNPMIVGKSAQAIADLAGITIPEGTKVLVARETGVGRGHPYSNEKLAPILAFYTAPDYVQVCSLCQEILHYEGAGHTFSIHTKDQKMVDYFAARVPASRIVVNTSSALGGIGATTNLMPALTLGCGAVGGSATSDNVGPMNLLNRRYVAEGTCELEDIKNELPDCSEGICRVQEKYDNIDIDQIVREIIKRIQSA